MCKQLKNIFFILAFATFGPFLSHNESEKHPASSRKTPSFSSFNPAPLVLSEDKNPLISHILSIFLFVQ